MVLTEEEASKMDPKQFRQYVRKGEFATTTRNACPGYAQANLVVVPKELAYHFFLFCTRNPKPCPIVDVTEPGNPHPLLCAPEADLRTDLPRYKVFKDGELAAEPTDIMDYWRDDSVAFLLGCSYTQDWIFRSAHIQYRLTGTFATNIPCIPASPFKGNLAVSCRIVKGSEDVVRVIQVSSRYPQVHGAPVHIGDPEAIGITNPYRSEMSPHAACVSSIVPLLQTRECQVAFPCIGDRRRAWASDDEIIFSAPVEKMEDLIAGLKAAREYGVGLPLVPSMPLGVPEMSPSYMEMAKLLGVEW